MSARDAAGYGQPGEPVLFAGRPSPLFILIQSLPGVLLTAIFVLVLDVGLTASGAPVAAFWVFWSGVGVVVVRVLWAWAEWLSRRYVLTRERVIAVAGVVRRSAADIPLRHARQTAITQSVPERILGLGTLTVATAAAGGFMLSWLAMARPRDVLARVREAMEAAQSDSPRRRADPPNPVPVVGLTGGVGSGKSEVARILGEHGFVVIDSDRVAKQALDRPAVRDQLVRWWGGAVVNPDGSVDRSAVAAIVFADPEQRRRLEGLIHPIVKESRRGVVAKAAAEGKAGVVIDAPLLFEAGSETECDAVVFVEAPEAARLHRVRESRGWDETELRRRENAQIPLEEKRRRSDLTIVNDAGRDDLRRRVEQVLPRLRRPR